MLCEQEEMPIGNLLSEPYFPPKALQSLGVTGYVLGQELKGNEAA